MRYVMISISMKNNILFFFLLLLLGASGASITSAQTALYSHETGDTHITQSQLGFGAFVGGSFIIPATSSISYIDIFNNVDISSESISLYGPFDTLGDVNTFWRDAGYFISNSISGTNLGTFVINPEGGTYDRQRFDFSNEALIAGKYYIWILNDSAGMGRSRMPFDTTDSSQNFGECAYSGIPGDCDGTFLWSYQNAGGSFSVWGFASTTPQATSTIEQTQNNMWFATFLFILAFCIFGLYFWKMK